MWDKQIIWVVLVAVILMLFASSNTLHDYISSGTIVVLLFMQLFNKPRRPFPMNLEGPATEIQGPAVLGFFHKARHFVLNNPIMTYIQGEDKTSQIMNLLSNHIIRGTAYDDSARSYPPRCQPGTRIKILERLRLWLQGANRLKSLLWLSGPAGVGKSAVMQTFAETVVHPGASLFVSRPNKRNDPNRIFTTIAYQLAVHIKAYRSYIVDLLSVNPYLLSKSIDVQFQVFIIEPFVKRRICASHGQRWAILLDGLDELEGEQAQRDVIRLISAFTQEHPEAPLAWIISSRPERHISDTFAERKIRDSHESENIPIDSTEASRDVERFLRKIFDQIRDEFPHTVPSAWPEEIAIVELARAASGHFIFADTAVRFIKDPNHANPTSRLEHVLSVIAHSNGVPTEEQPFALLDNLYKAILSRIPSCLWQKTKLLLRLVLSFHINDTFLGLSRRPKSRTLRGMAMILRLDRYTVYASLDKCYSMLGIPSWEEADEQSLTFLHASFADFLINPERSGKFTIAVDDVEEEVLHFYLDSWHARFEVNSVSDDSSVDERGDEVTPEPVDNFNLWEDTTTAILTQIVKKCVSRLVVSAAVYQGCFKCVDSFRRINMITLCYSKYLDCDSLTVFVEDVFAALQEFPYELRESGFLRQIPFKDVTWDHLDWPKQRFLLRAPRISWSETREVKDPSDTSGGPPILMCGAVAGGRVAFVENSDGLSLHLVPYYG